ncbi:group III truncated hemoglobin [Lysobacter sp. TY2-98]|uniref:group III truncated hemoglobin n=1 Tax=Lysobacter sp. TY2-98 TaxID=2290922 RepID=UPI000E20838C|nr:group III truncated hemoglobin [Lysobacter sp. TY2-98]AXK73261.1 group III truncated hemoglobin [Lysobacter sp. TY2-98]
MTDTPLTEADIARLVDRFYDRVQAHPTLGPVFARAVDDWPAHKATLVDFWSSIELKTGRYRGRPMAVHRPHPIAAAHFADWLALWAATARAELTPGQAERFVEHAERIARSLMYGLGIDGTRRPLGLPIVGGAP